MVCSTNYTNSSRGGLALLLSLFHLRGAASGSNRLLRVTWAKTTAPTWLAAVDPIWTLLLLNEARFSVSVKDAIARDAEGGASALKKGTYLLYHNFAEKRV